MSLRNSHANEICERHGYPGDIEVLLESICSIAQAHIAGLRAILLSGSVATGDLVWKIEDGTLNLFSDLDLIVFADHPGSTPDAFEKEIDELEGRYRNPLFHIDLSLSPSSALRRLQPSYQMTELKQSSPLLFGEDVLSGFPDEFERSRSLQSFFSNLWKVILYWPDGDALREETFRFILARLILDVPLLVFSELGEMVPGHRSRARAFGDLTEERHPLANSIVKDAVRTAISVREFKEPIGSDLWPVFRRVLDSTLEYLEIELANPDLDESHLCARIASKLPRRSVRRTAGELRSAFRSFDNPVTGFAWAIRRKEAWAGAANLRMIQGLGGTEAAESLSRTSVCLSRFCGTEVALNEAPDPIAKFRSAYWIGLRRLYPSMEKNDAFVRHAGDGFSD